MEEEYKKGEVVWAKIKGFAWWPAIVTKICGLKEKELEITIHFIGDNSYATLHPSKIRKYRLLYDEFTANKKNKKLLASIQSADIIQNYQLSIDIDKTFFCDNTSSKELKGMYNKCEINKPEKTIKKSLSNNFSNNNPTIRAKNHSSLQMPSVKKNISLKFTNKNEQQSHYNTLLARKIFSKQRNLDEYFDQITCNDKQKKHFKKLNGPHQYETMLSDFFEYLLTVELNQHKLTENDLDIEKFVDFANNLQEDQDFKDLNIPKINFYLRVIKNWFQEYQHTYSRESLPEYFLMIDHLTALHKNVTDKFWSEWSSIDEFLQNIRKKISFHQDEKKIYASAEYYNELNNVFENPQTQNDDCLLSSEEAQYKDKILPKKIYLKKRNNSIEPDILNDAVQKMVNQNISNNEKISDLESENKNIIKPNQNPINQSNGKTHEHILFSKIETQSIGCILNNTKIEFDPTTIKTDNKNLKINEKTTTTQTKLNECSNLFREFHKNNNSTSSNIGLKRKICHSLLGVFKKVCQTNISMAQKCSFAVESALSKAHSPHSIYYKETIRLLLQLDGESLSRIVRMFQTHGMNLSIDTINECLMQNTRIDNLDQRISAQFFLPPNDKSLRST